MARAFRAKVNRRVLHPDQPPITMHHASFHRLGGEIVMDIGFHDMAKLVENIKELEGAEASGAHDEPLELEIDVTVFAQYAMGADTFVRLRQNVEEIYRAMVRSGHIPEEVEPVEEAK